MSESADREHVQRTGGLKEPVVRLEKIGRVLCDGLLEVLSNAGPNDSRPIRQLMRRAPAPTRRGLLPRHQPYLLHK